MFLVIFHFTHNALTKMLSDDLLPSSGYLKELPYHINLMMDFIPVQYCYVFHMKVY